MKKIERKVKKKIKKITEELQKNLLIDISETSTQTLCLCNFGLMTGISSDETVADIFISFGVLQDILLIPHKSYSFVKFNETYSAEKALKTLQCTLIPNFGMLILAYVTDLPSRQQISGKTNNLPPGLEIILDAIPLEVENSLLSTLTWANDSNTILKNRQVQHFGYEFNYSTNSIDTSKPIRPFPTWWKEMIPGIETFDQCTVNKYEPGQGIPPHIDSHSCCSDCIISLSLGSSIVMNFTDPNDDVIPVFLPSRSLLIMKGPARYIYKHGISCKTSDIVPKSQNEELTLVLRKTRVSLTFRQTSTISCSCNYPAYCDSSKKFSLEKCYGNPTNLEKHHVHSVYENIAEHFSETRHRPWPKVMEFVSSLCLGDILLDVGCGNGKYLGISKNNFQIGLDYSISLLNIVRQKDLEGLRSDILNLPFKSKSVDAILCIAVIHHLSTLERRKAALREICRVLRIGGKALVYAWAKNQVKDTIPSSYIKSKRNEIQKTSYAKMETQFPLFLPVHTNRTSFEHSDVLVPWTKNDNYSHFFRFYHVFEEKELEELLKDISELVISDSYYDQGNWCLVLTKQSE